MDEIWASIPGTSGIYEASNLGRVRSVPRKLATSNGKILNLKGRILSPSTSKWGHKRVNFHFPDGTDQTWTVHRAVMKAFTKDRTEEGLVVCHENGDPSDNRLSNLRWDTLSSNSYDMERHGTNIYRNRTHCPRKHRLTEPNLVAGKLKLGFRSCRACHQARSDLKEGSLLTWEEMSDIRYEMILRDLRFPVRERKGWEIRFIESGRDLILLDDLPRRAGNR